MEKIRINERNNITIEIRRIENLVKKNTETIERYRSQPNSVYTTTQIEKLNVLNKQHEQKLTELKLKYDDVSAGALDTVLTQNIADSNKVVQDKLNLSKVKLYEKKTKQIENKAFLDNKYKNNRREGMSDSYLQKETDRFFNNLNSVPDYILENLKNMSSNKGYIWRGIACFGEKQQDKDNNLILFEKCKGNLLKIHEYTDTHYIYSEKVGKNQKVIIEKTKKPKILSEQGLNKIKYLASK